MKIYYSQANYSLQYITNRCVQRLIEEGNSEASIDSWMSRGVETAELSEFGEIVDNYCNDVRDLYAENEISYVIAELDDSDFVYIGIGDKTLIDADGQEIAPR